jgi:hypothetical protein
MSITATTNYMSNAFIQEWMENKTEGLYGDMREAMDTSTHRADAEAELNKIKALIVDAKNNGGDPKAVQQEIRQALVDFKDVPELTAALQPMADKITQMYKDAQPPPRPLLSPGARWIAPPLPPPAKISSDQSDSWSKSLGDVVDGLGKQDQLGLINIQELNSQINQAKQIASALIDAADKSANAIISHIA